MRKLCCLKAICTYSRPFPTIQRDTLCLLLSNDYKVLSWKTEGHVAIEELQCYWGGVGLAVSSMLKRPNGRWPIWFCPKEMSTPLSVPLYLLTYAVMLAALCFTYTVPLIAGTDVASGTYSILHSQRSYKQLKASKAIQDWQFKISPSPTNHYSWIRYKSDARIVSTQGVWTLAEKQVCDAMRHLFCCVQRECLLVVSWTKHNPN